MGQLSDETWSEECKWCIWSSDKVVIRSLHPQSVDNALTSDLVVGLEDIMEILDGVLVIAHVPVIEEVTGADDLSMTTVTDGLASDATVHPLLATKKRISKFGKEKHHRNAEGREGRAGWLGATVPFL